MIAIRTYIKLSELNRDATKNDRQSVQAVMVVRLRIVYLFRFARCLALVVGFLAWGLVSRTGTWRKQAYRTWRLQQQIGWLRRVTLELKDVLSESHLVIPISEFLVSQGWSDLKAEQHTISLGIETGRPGVINRGDINYDLVAQRGSDKLLMEFKCAKTEKNVRKVSRQRLIKDVVKLALPHKGFDTRLLVVAEQSDLPIEGLISLIDKSRRACFKLSVNGDKVTVSCNDMPSPLSGSEHASVRRIMSDETLRECTAALVAESSQGKNKVLIWSVRR